MTASNETQMVAEATPGLTARELAVRIADILTDTPASNTLLLEITEFSSVADFFLLCSGENERQLRAISEEINEELAKEGIRPLRMEGTPQSGWIVLDYGEVVAHIFSSELRDFYRLEQLWAEAPRVLSIQ
ncbi:MAG: ribosome silencing factor [Thermomicrobiales bacterium]|nr:ribosome silencing factor [Thermomicrobiales bacterium]